MTDAFFSKKLKLPLGVIRLEKHQESYSSLCLFIYLMRS